MKKILTLILLISTNSFAHNKDNIDSFILKEENKNFITVMDPIKFANAYGNANDSAYGRFGKFPANFETPVHTHAHSYRAIVIKGLMTNPFNNEKKSPVMKPGSYWSVKANEIHSTACISEIPCEFFVYSEYPFDFEINK
ncbi:DUF4437 domain-containing protein [Aeromonas salmonicida]|uniref:DUF4437 domain-containing protein n=1 Tax=Aeromonas salmonicida TaxID=645 RepID=UPI000BB59658|nr:DUF4437 domain-containing protein [Aeromonas salmonicida]QOI94981.1 DUF4437 domain-containing protein [Aeromonas salmonicida subsp. masoucida]